MIFDTKEHKEITLKLVNSMNIQGNIDEIQEPLKIMLELRESTLNATIEKPRVVKGKDGI